MANWIDEMSKESSYTNSNNYSQYSYGFTIVKGGVIVKGFRNARPFWANRATAERNLSKFKGGEVVEAKKLLGDAAKGNMLAITIA